MFDLNSPSFLVADSNFELCWESSSSRGRWSRATIRNRFLLCRAPRTRPGLSTSRGARAGGGCSCGEIGAERAVMIRARAIAWFAFVSGSFSSFIARPRSRIPLHFPPRDTASELGLLRQTRARHDQPLHYLARNSNFPVSRVMFDAV